MKTNWRIRHDYLLVKLIENSKDSSGIFVDQDYEKNKHQTVIGKVIAVPNKLRYTGREAHKIRQVKSRSSRQQLKLLRLNAYSLDYDVDMELQVGDTIWIDFTAILEAKQSGLVTKEGLLVRYDGVILAKRNDSIIPVNGNVIIESLKEDEDIKIARNVSKLENRGKVIYAGKTIRHYKYYPTHTEYDDIKAGDVIVHRKSAGIPIEMPMYQKLDKPYLFIKRRDILCTETT